VNAAETARLVNLLISTWPAGVKGYVWTDTLGPLDHDPALAAYLELREHDERPPSVARYLAAYHAQRARTDDPPTSCQICDGTGWEELDHPAAHNPLTCHPDDEHPCACTAVRPCRCSAGRRRALAHRSIVEFNARALHRPPPRAAAEPEQTELTL